MAAGVLIIDDEKKLSALLARILELEGYQVHQAHTGKEGLRVLGNEEILVVLSDVKLPDIDGVELVRKIKEKQPYVEVINLTAFGTIPDGVRAMKNGAFDYITKGDDNDKIIPLLNTAMEKSRLQYKVHQLEDKLSRQHSFDTIIGNSKVIREAIDLARKVAVTDATVLLLGETGTGKEVFAQAIHYESRRRQHTFVALNCSGFSAELLESELFGYKAGAFTGAVKDKKGILDEANGGTIFLDEVGEMSLDLQAKLLRILESQTFIRVGDTQTSKVNVRIIAATNRDLQEEAEAGRFRLDLFYRLSGFCVRLPSLAQRKGDIRMIANHYLKEFAAKVNKSELVMSEEFAELIDKHQWKGNIRELKNVMERAAILADDKTITPNLLPYEFMNELAPNSSMDMKVMEKQHIKRVLHHTRGNKTETARLLGIGLTTLYRKLEEYGIED